MGHGRRGPGGVTAVYALLGDPVEHSPSPAIYQAAFRDLGLDATFVSRVVTGSELAAVMREVAATGGGNVTLPHKLLAAAALDAPSSSVLRTGACNCFWRGPDGSLCGDNTDVGGLLTAVHRLERSCDLEGATQGLLRFARVTQRHEGSSAQLEGPRFELPGPVCARSFQLLVDQGKCALRVPTRERDAGKAVPHVQRVAPAHPRISGPVELGPDRLQLLQGTV